MSSDLHIITLNNPWPAIYGGMIDTFHRIVNLGKLGVSITLHCYSNNNLPDNETSKYCKKVYFYPRNNSISSFLSNRPYIISSRDSKQLIQNLKSDNAPVLFDGLHTTSLLTSDILKYRKKIVRAHNIESQYYESLASAETNPFKRFVFSAEAAKLKRYEKILSKANAILAISHSDLDFLSQIHSSVFLSPPFHPFERHIYPEGKQDYMLMHGDLSISENRICALQLIQQASGKNTRLIITGKKPDSQLIGAASEMKNVEIIADPDNDMIIKLISNAAVNVVPAISTNGFRIKLIYCLYNGGHCVATRQAVSGTGLENLCHVTNDIPQAWNLGSSLIKVPYTKAEAELRNKVLSDQLDPVKNAKRLISLIYG